MVSERVRKAREAFASGDFDGTVAAHTEQEIAYHKTGGTGEYVGNMVYGALDGIVTTFAVVVGAAGAGLHPGVVIIIGMSNLIADGLSMAAGNYLSMKSMQSYYDAERKREAWEVEHYPEGERREVEDIYRRKGFVGKNLEKLVEIITSKKTVWIDTMMVDELGLVPDKKDPLKAGIYTFLSFAIVGFVPLSVFIFSLVSPLPKAILFPAAVILTFATIFIVGSLRSLVIAKDWLTAGLEMLLIGGLTAVISYSIGSFLGSLVL